MKNFMYVREYETELDSINVIMELANQIRAKGHNIRISLASSADTFRKVNKKLAESDLENIESPVPPIKITDTHTSSHTELMQNLSCFRTSDDFELSFKSWLTLFEREAPDLIICDFAPTALLAAKQLGISIVLFDLGFFIPDSDYISPSFVDQPISSLQTIHKAPLTESEKSAEKYLLDLVNAIFLKNSFSPLDNFSNFYTADKTLWLNYNELFSCTTNTTDAEPAARADTDIAIPWNTKNLDSPKIFAHLNQDDPASMIIIQTLKYNRYITSVIYIPNCHREIKEAYDSERLIIVDQPINIPKILKNADLVINNAEAGLTAQSLLAGKPVLLAPTSLEQRLNADKAVKLGAAIWLPEDITHHAVSFGVFTSLLNGYHTVSARAFASKYQPIDAASIADTVIETAYTNERKDLNSLQKSLHAGSHVNISSNSTPRQGQKNAPGVCAILLSYKRPQNIERIIKELVATPNIKHVILSNNNPDIDLSKQFDLNQYPIDFIQQSGHEKCIKRFEIALDLPYDYFICPDDDIFLNPQQLQALLYFSQRDKSRVHGVFGQIRSFHYENGLGLFSGVHGVSSEIEILNRLYCFSREHLLEMLDLTKQLNFKSMSDILHIDDLLISFTGQNRPMCHDLGLLEECPSSLEPGIAVCAEDGFDQIRLETYRHLVEITGRY